MPNFSQRILPYLFIILVALLTAVGVTMSYSASICKASSEMYFFQRELMWVIVGIMGAIFVYFVGYQRIQRYSYYILALAASLLIITPFLGPTINNTKRWLRLGPITIQPSEFAKYAVIIFIAAYLAKNRRNISSLFKGYLLPLMPVMLIAALIFAGRDLGAIIIIVVCAGLMFFVAGTKISALIGSCGLGAILGAIGIYLEPYRIARLIAFWNPDKYATKEAYHINQSLMAICSGGLNGVGLGSSFSKVSNLPEAHTDFIFAIIAEELGLIYTLCIITLWILLLLVMYLMIPLAKDYFGKMVMTGFMIILGIQSCVNMAVVLQCLPTKGLTLPFISYGGSSLVLTLTMCGLMISIVKPWQNLEYRIGGPCV